MSNTYIITSYFVLWIAGIAVGWVLCRSRFKHIVGNVYKRIPWRSKSLREDPIGDYSNGLHIIP